MFYFGVLRLNSLNLQSVSLLHGEGCGRSHHAELGWAAKGLPTPRNFNFTVPSSHSHVLALCYAQVCSTGVDLCWL